MTDNMLKHLDKIKASTVDGGGLDNAEMGRDCSGAGHRFNLDRMERLIRAQQRVVERLEEAFVAAKLLGRIPEACETACNEAESDLAELIEKEWA